MEENNIITKFVPAMAIESPSNTFPDASLSDKLRLALRRYLTSGNMETGEINQESPKLIIEKYQLDPINLGYNVIARII